MKPLFSAGILALLVPAALLTAQSPAPAPQVTVDYDNPGLNPSHWVLTLSPDGTGHFRSERNPAPTEATPVIAAPEVDRPIRLSSPFANRVFESARNHKLFNENCEAHLKVAFQGWKTLSYSGPEGTGSCRFNYSRDREIQALSESLIAVAGSILEGARLEKFLQHDRLGLDKEIEYLADAAADGRMIELCAIRGILERLSEDPSVMERVRKRARQLLSRSDQ